MRLLKQIKSYFPRALPVGMVEFNEWVAEVIYISGLPDNQSTRTLAADFIIRGVPLSWGSISVRTISKQLRRAAAMQVANAVRKENEPQPTLKIASKEVVPEAKE
jgi:excinuclease UvrABC helicase subunit UvrB